MPCLDRLLFGCCRAKHRPRAKAGHVRRANFRRRNSRQRACFRRIPRRHACQRGYIKTASGAFSDPYGWYARILTSEFAQPKEINLKELFYKGITEADSTLTDEETVFLADTWTEDECSLDTYRIPADGIDDILQKYLGVSFEDTLKTGIDDLTYWEKTNAYYLSHGDTNAVNVKIISAYLNEDGTITMTYCDALSDPSPEKTAVLKPCDGGYLIISNQPAV